MAGNLTLNDVIDPSGWARRREHAEDLNIKRAELDLKSELAGYQYRQADTHHAEQIELGYARLNLDAQTESRKLAVLSEQHADKMQAIARQDALEDRKLNTLEARTTAEIALGQDRLNFDREQANASALTTLENTKLQTAGAVYIAELQARNALTVSREGHENALALVQEQHKNAMDLAREQAHLDTVKMAGMLPYEMATSSIRRGEEHSRAMSGAIGDIFREKMREKMAEKFETQKEAHRSNERRHEVKMAILKARLDEHGFTHEEIIKLIIRLSDPSADMDASDEALFQKYTHWYAERRE